MDVAMEPSEAQQASLSGEGRWRLVQRRQKATPEDQLIFDETLRTITSEVEEEVWKSLSQKNRDDGHRSHTKETSKASRDIHRIVLQVTDIPFLILWVYGSYWAVVVVDASGSAPPNIWWGALVASILVGVGLNANAYNAIRRPKRKASPSSSDCGLPPRLAHQRAITIGNSMDTRRPLSAPAGDHRKKSPLVVEPIFDIPEVEWKFDIG